MINHRGPEFQELLYETTDRLKKVFSTREDVFIITGSGTAAMEAAVVNTLSPGDVAINATVGVFGNRFGIIGERYGVKIIPLEFQFGSAVDIDKLRECIEANPEARAVMVTHNETSTGVSNDLKSIASVIKKEYGKLVLVDGISSVCSLPLETDTWGLDVVATASQKGWMLPHPTFFVKKKIYEKYGLYNTELKSAADYEMILRLLYKHNISFCYINKILVKMRSGGQSNVSLINRIRANREDIKAWKINRLSPPMFLRIKKPFSKLKQFFLRPKK